MKTSLKIALKHKLRKLIAVPAIAAGLLASTFDAQPAKAQGIPTLVNKYVVFVYLPGGADTLSMMQPDEGRSGPYAIDLHVQRPTIFRTDNPATPAQEILPLGTTGYAVPSQLSEFQIAYNNNQFAAIQKVGIPNIPRNQEEAEDIVARGIPTADGTQTEGWMHRLGRLNLRSPLEVWDVSGGHKTTVGGYVYRPTTIRDQFINTMNFLPLPSPSTASENRFRLDTAFLVASKGGGFSTIEQDKMNGSIAAYKNLFPLVTTTTPLALAAGQEYTGTSTFARQFRALDLAFAKFREAKFGFIRGAEQENFGGQGAGARTWDTHRNEITLLNSNLTDLNDALRRFRLNMGSRPHGGGGSNGTMWDNTVVIIYTDHGRTVAENNTGGTDDGEGSTVFMLGGAVRPGIYGSIMSLNDVYSTRNVIPVETNLVNVWWEVASALGYDPTAIFPGHSGMRLGIIK